MRKTKRRKTLPKRSSHALAVDKALKVPSLSLNLPRMDTRVKLGKKVKSKSKIVTSRGKRRGRGKDLKGGNALDSGRGKTTMKRLTIHKPHGDFPTVIAPTEIIVTVNGQKVPAFFDFDHDLIKFYEPVKTGSGYISGLKVDKKTSDIVKKIQRTTYYGVHRDHKPPHYDPKWSPGEYGEGE